MDLATATLVIQILGAILIGWIGWTGRREVGRIDAQGDQIKRIEPLAERGAALEGRFGAFEARLGALEASNQVMDVRLAAAPSTETLRAVIREELDRAVAPIHRDLDDLRGRVRTLEE